MQRLSAIMSDGNLAAPSAGTANPGKTSGDFQKFITNMKRTENRKNSVNQGNTAIQKKNASVNQSGVYDSMNDNVQQVSQKFSTGETNRFTKNDFLQVEDEVKSVVKDVLEMDENAFQQALASMGITAIQLLDPKVLQQFVVRVNGGTDATDLLTSEKMMQQFSALSDSLLETDWKTMTGLTGQQFSQLTAESFDDSEFLQILTDQLNSGTVEAGIAAEDAPVVEELIGDPKISQAEESILATDDAPEVTSAEQEDVPVVSADDVENVNTPIVAENTVPSEKTSSEKVQVSNEDVILMSNGSDENVSNAGTDDLPQNAFQDGEETAGQSENQVLYYEDTPVTATESQTIMNFVENMVQASNVEQVKEPVNLQQMIDIVNQVVERVHSSLQDETTTLEMQLNPERLGKMLLTVNSRDGVMTASITVQNTEAKAALESQMITLRENLEQKNLKVEAVEVSVSDFAFSQSGQADAGDQKNYQQGNGKRARFQYDSEDEEVENSQEAEEQVRRSVMMDQGSSVDFTA